MGYHKNKRKAQFFSLTVFLIVLSMIIFFAIVASTVRTEEDFNMQRLEKTVANSYISDFDKLYTEQIVRTALKPAIYGALEKKEILTKNRLVHIMKSGDTNYMDEDLGMDKTLEGVLGLTTYSLQNSNFQVDLEKVNQSVANKVEFTFLIDYEFRLGNDIWKKEDKVVVVTMDIYSLYHPGWSYFPIDADWIVDTNISVQCFSTQIISDAEPCQGQNMRPSFSTPSINVGTP